VPCSRLEERDEGLDAAVDRDGAAIVRIERQMPQRRGRLFLGRHGAGLEQLHQRDDAACISNELQPDSEANVSEIAKYNGIKPLVALLEPEASGGDAETQRQAAVVLADMARVQAAYGATVAKEGGIPLLVGMLRTSSTIEAKAEAAGALLSLATEHAREMGEAGAIEPLVDLLKSDATAVADTSSLTRAHAQPSRRRARSRASRRVAWTTKTR